MAWSVDQIYSFVRFLSRKNQSGGISATDLFYAWNAEQTAYFSDLLGGWENRGNQKTGTNSGLPLNEVVLSELAPFVKNAACTIAAGSAPKPADFARKFSATLGAAEVRFASPTQRPAITKSVIDPPSVTDNCYYAIEYANSFSILPNTATGNLSLDYLANPVDIVWQYTLDVNGRQVYDSTNSTQPQWHQTEIVAITKRTLKLFGLSFKDGDFQNFGNTAVQTGD